MEPDIIVLHLPPKITKNCYFRTDSQDRHINGQGNFGFCSSSCNDRININADTNYVGIDSRSKFVAAEKENDPTAVVFEDNQDTDAVQMPPS